MDKRKFKQSINWYIKNGIPIVPVDAPVMGNDKSGKGVHYNGWQKSNKEKLWDAMKKHDGNVGIRLDDYLVLDVDCPEKAKILLGGIQLPETAVCYRSDTTLEKALAFESRAHFYFKKSAKLEKTATLHDGKDENGKPITVVELRTGRGAQMVAPPSIHYTGTSYLMHNAKMLTNLPECPPEIIAIVTSLKDADESTSQSFPEETSDIDDIVLKVLAETPEASSDYVSFVKMCLAFKSKGYTYDQVDRVFACGQGYNAKENRRIYNLCRPSGKITMKTAYHIAQKTNPKLLEKLMAEGKKPKTCNSCGAEIAFGKNAKGKWIPVTSDGKPHRCKKTAQAPEEAQVQTPEQAQETKRSLLVWKDEKGKPVEGLVAKAFFEQQNGNLLYNLGDFYEYNQTRGCWEIAKDGEIQKKILDFVGEDLAKTSLLKNVAYQIMLRAQMPKNFNFNPNPMLLNLKNCVIDIKTMQTVPHCREFFFDHSINAAFTDDAACPRWRQFLDEVELTRETQMRLQEWFGYCLTRETRIEKCLYLRGEGANGKSRIIQTLGNMIGKEITSNLQPQDLVAEKHRMHLLKGKLLNFSTDINAKVVMDGKFKRIVSGEEVVGEPKNKDAFSFAPYAKHVFAANDFMPTKDRSFGFFRRFDLLELPRIFSDDEKDFGLQEKLDREIDGIFLWALAGLQRLLSNNWLMTESQQMQATMEQYMQDNNPVKAYVIWLQETGFFSEKDKVETVHLYEQYKSWCDSKNYRPMGDNSFGREMARLGFGKKRLRSGGARCHYYIVPEKYTKALEMEEEQQSIVKIAVVQPMAAKSEVDERVKALEEQKKQLEDALAKSLMETERDRERAEKSEKKKNTTESVVSQQMLFEAKKASKFNHYEED